MEPQKKLMSYNESYWITQKSYSTTMIPRLLGVAFYHTMEIRQGM